eukprot:13394286-Alexandrium_andersonii.AAC.1
MDLQTHRGRQKHNPEGRANTGGEASHLGQTHWHNHPLNKHAFHAGAYGLCGTPRCPACQSAYSTTPPSCHASWPATC